MSNRQIDELMYNLRKKMDNGIENKELSIILSNELIYKIIKEEFQIESNKMVDDILKKILTDFYAYYLYKLELDDNIDNNVVVMLKEFNELSSEEDVISYGHFDGCSAWCEGTSDTRREPRRHGPEREAG